MTRDLQQELFVSAFVQQGTIGWPLDRQATKNEGPGGEAQGLGGGISLQADALNGFQLPKSLLGKRNELRALKYSVSFLKAAGSCRDVMTMVRLNMLPRQHGLGDPGEGEEEKKGPLTKDFVTPFTPLSGVFGQGLGNHLKTGQRGLTQD